MLKMFALNILMAPKNCRNSQRGPPKTMIPVIDDTIL